MRLSRRLHSRGNLREEARSAGRVREASVESHEAVLAPGAQSEVERVGCGKLQLWAPRKLRRMRAHCRRLRQALRPAAGERLELKQRGLCCFRIDEPGAHATMDEREELGRRPIADIDRARQLLESSKGSGRM